MVRVTSAVGVFPFPSSSSPPALLHFTLVFMSSSAYSSPPVQNAPSSLSSSTTPLLLLHLHLHLPPPREPVDNNTIPAMFLIDKRSPADHLFSPLLLDKPHGPSSSAFARRFEDALAARLRSLLPVPAPPAAAVPLSWYSRAVRALALTLSDAAALLSDPGSSAADRAALAAHLDSGVALLDAANAVAAEVDRLLRRRLLLRFALHLLSSDGGAGRARDSVAEWRSCAPRGIRSDAAVLARSLAPSALPTRGKISAVRRAIYAVEAVSGLIVGAVVAMLGGGELAEIRVPAELSWAREFEKLAEAVAGKPGGGFAAEVEAVEAAVERLTDVMDEATGVDGEKTERIRRAAEETEKLTEELTVGLEALSTDVNRLFRAALGTRNTALQNFRTGAHKCK